MTNGPSKADHKVWIEGEQRPQLCTSGERLLLALERSGVGAVRIGCRQGGCGACRVKIISGTYVTKKMSRAHVTEAEEKQGYALSCRVFPESDLVIRPAFQGLRRTK